MTVAHPPQHAPADTVSPAPPPGPGGAPATLSAATDRRRFTPVGLLERWALLGLLVAVALFFSVYSKSSSVFPTSANVGVITGNQAVVAVVAIAALFPLIGGHFDFSVGATSAFTSVLCAAMMSRHGLSLGAAIAVAVVVGAVIGLVNGLLIAYYRTNAFITTLGAATLLGGLISWYSNDQSITTGISKDLTNFGSLSWFDLPRLVFLVVVLAILAWYVLAQTPYGRALYAIGSNPRAAKLVGLPTQRYVLVAFVISGTLAGVAGVLTTARTGGSTTDTGTTVLFGALAAVFLGLTAVTPGRFNVIGTMIGVLFVATSVSGLTLAGASDWVQPVFNGGALLVAVVLSTYLTRRRRGTDAP